MDWGRRVNLDALAAIEIKRGHKTGKHVWRTCRRRSCRKRFRQHDVRQVYCSKKCRESAHIERYRKKYHWRTCPECGENPVRTKTAKRCKECWIKNLTKLRVSKQARAAHLTAKIKKGAASLLDFI